MERLFFPNLNIDTRENRNQGPDSKAAVDPLKTLSAGRTGERPVLGGCGTRGAGVSEGEGTAGSQGGDVT